MRHSRSRGRRSGGHGQAHGQGRVRLRHRRRADTRLSDSGCDSRSPARPVRRRRRVPHGQVRRRRNESFDSRDDGEGAYEDAEAGYDRSPRMHRRRSPQRQPGTGVNAIPLGRGLRSDDAEEETQVRIFVLHSDCSKIIGRQGRALREIEARARCRVKVQKEDEMDPTTKERAVDIIGSRREQDAAIEMILALAQYCREDGGEVLKDSRVTGDKKAEDGTELRVIEVLPEEVGKVLGRKGDTVKVLEKESGTKIDVEKGIGRIEIRGQSDALDRAVEAILAEVSFAKDKDGNILKDVPQKKQRGEDEPELPPPVKLWIRDRDAGKVIGRGGETIREIMEKSGADIKVQKSDEMAPGTNEREIRIIGTKEQQDQATELILAEVSWVKGADGMLKDAAAEAAATSSRRDKKASDRRRNSDDQKKAEKDEKTKTDKEEDKDDEEDEKPEKKGKDDGKSRRGERAKKGAKGAGKFAMQAMAGGPCLWVCATCGGDHRTKECPHATGILGIGVQLGMQMGLQAMGLPPPPPGGLPPLGPLPPGLGHLPPFGMPLPPGMPGMPGMHGIPGMLPMPGLPPLLPGMMRPPLKMLRGYRSRRSGSSSSSYSGSSSGSRGSSEEDDEEDSAASEGVHGRHDSRREPARHQAELERPRKRRRVRRLREGEPPQMPVVEDVGAEAPRRRRRRRRVDQGLPHHSGMPEAQDGLMETSGQEPRLRKRRHDRDASGLQEEHRRPPVKKKIILSDL